MEPSDQSPAAQPLADTPEAAAAHLVAEWVATLFRTFPTAGDLDRLTAAVTAAVKAAADRADARTAAVIAAAEAAARGFHAERHQGLYESCGEAPCPDLRAAVAPPPQSA